MINQSARSLRLQRTHTIGLIVPLGHERDQLITDPFFLEMIGRLADEITGRGYEVLLNKVVAPRADWLRRIVQSHRSDGLLIIGQSDQHEALNALADTYRPLVVWGGDIAERRYCTVGSDNVAGARLATQHMIAQGRRRIAFLGLPGAPEVELRREGYLQALREAGLSPYPELSAPAHFTIESAEPSVRALIDSGATFDGVLAASDLIAVTAINTLTAAGRTVPDEIDLGGRLRRHQLGALQRSAAHDSAAGPGDGRAHHGGPPVPPYRGGLHRVGLHDARARRARHMRPDW